MKKLIKDIDVIATFNEKLEEIKNGWILINENIIEDLGSDKPPRIGEGEIISGKGMLILPGFINTHHHFYQSLFRSVKEVQNAKLFDWLVFLYEKWKDIDEEAIYISSVVAMLELMKSGVTTTTDHLYLFPKNHPLLFDSEVNGARLTRVRFYGTRGSMSLSRKNGGLPPDSVVQKEEEILRDYERVVKKYNNPEPFSMLRVALAPCSPFSVTESLMKETLKFAEKYDLLLHTHLAETKDEDDFCLSKVGLRPVDYMEKLGWLNSRVWFVHLVHVNDSDIKKLSDFNVGMAHCPTSNMRLGSGISPVVKMKNTGIRIGLGVDGSSSNDTGNFLQEIRNAMLLQRVANGAESITPRDVLSMGTTGGAKVLKLEKEIGSIEKGKAADIIGFNMERLEFAGALSDPVAALVLCDAKSVDISIINGDVVIENGKFKYVDELEFIRRQNKISKKLLS
jgi:cytosine/adenosine deaminase-related metal-dependent hydrolase